VAGGRPGAGGAAAAGAGGRRVAEDAGASAGADLSARDNAALAVAMSTVTGALDPARPAGLIDDAELLRMAYRFAG
jgi:hypothetical protein